MKRLIRTHEAQTPCCKEWCNSFRGELAQLPLDDLDGRELLILIRFCVSANLVEDLGGRRIIKNVFERNPMHSGYGLGLAALRKEILGRLVKMEEKEATDEHEKGHGTKSEKEVSPTHVLCFVATRFTANIAR